MFNKKAQIGESVTWVFATIVIIIMLSISIILAKSFNSDRLVLSLGDKERDIVATTSINSFLSQNEVRQMLTDGNYGGLSPLISDLLTNLPAARGGSAGGWNFELYDGAEKKMDINTYNLVGNLGQNDDFELEYEFENLKLKFWMTCQGECKA